MKPTVFRFTTVCGCPVPYPRWWHISYFPGATVGEGDVIEYAYGPPVVTDERVERALAAYNRSRGTYEYEEPTDLDDIRAALTAALEAE